MKSVFLSALHKSSGKTSVTIGLSRALTDRGDTIQPFKKGPDYIDSMWLGRSAKRACFNLDFHTMNEKLISSTFKEISVGANFALVEGNKGLFDGVDLQGKDSNAALAKLLGTPVVVVVDTRGMTRGVAPVLLGYQAFDKNLQIAGVILNQVGGSRHEHKLRASIENYTDVPIIGAIGQHKEMSISERHLGLIPTNEEKDVDNSISIIAKIVKENVDLDLLEKLASSAPNNPTKKKNRQNLTSNIRIAIARDNAFGFYYQDDLKAFKHYGATLVPFNTLSDTSLPDVDGLFIGGGFPETHSTLLEKNKSLRDDIKNRLISGMPAYAECGGLMYLSRKLTWQGNTNQMVGFIPGDIIMQQKPVGRGYVNLNKTEKYPWGFGTVGNIQAHEFHYASLENLPKNITFAYDVKRGYGINGTHDGIVIDNLLASFSHQRNIGKNNWVERFTSFVRNNKGI